jgi:hypothetical protein
MVQSMVDADHCCAGIMDRNGQLSENGTVPPARSEPFVTGGVARNDGQRRTHGHTVPVEKPGVEDG